MFIDIDKYLNHQAQHWTCTADGYGSRSAATQCTTLTCLVYYGERKEMAENGNFVRTHGWSMLCQTAVESILSTGDLITSVIDQEAITVLNTATITKKIPYRHWDYGMNFVELYLEEV